MEDRIEYSTATLLEMLYKQDIKATFFVLGYVADKHPNLIRQIVSAGHEIGSHGYWHKMISRQTKVEFKEELLSSKHVLEDITGRQINLFRAPSWSISADTLWALEILEEEGFRCDSSIQPFKTPLSGIVGAPVGPYYPIIRGRKLNLLEFPPTVLQIGFFRIPFAGGFYFRALPRRMIIHALSVVNKKHPGMVYVHPWEIDTGQPRVDVPTLNKLIHYLNLDKNIYKLEHLLMSFKFVPLGCLLDYCHYPSIPIIKEQDIKHGD